jgi:hypothetical protein
VSGSAGLLASLGFVALAAAVRVVVYRFMGKRR